MKKIIVLALGLISLATVGQEKLEIIDLENIRQNIELKAQSEDFKGILEELAKVNKNDTAYANSLITKSFYLLALERYEEAGATIDEGLSMKTGDLKSSFYQNKGNLLIRQEKYDEAISTFNKGLELFPANHLLRYNKAIALDKKGLHKEAVDVLEQVIAINPVYANAYLKLGFIYYAQERPAQALLAFNMALMMEPDGPNSFERLRAINTMFSTANENKRTPGLILSEDDKAFDEIDLIISNQIALNKNYKIDNDLDFSLTKQNHALLLKLMDFNGKGGFWSKRMVPFFQWIKTSEHFDVFSYTIAYSIENEKHKRIVEKNTKEISEFIGVALPQWAKIIQKDNTSLISDSKVQYVYSGNPLYLSAMGNYDGNEKPIGKWAYFNQNGRKAIEGNFKEGERSGTWKWFDEHLNPNEVAFYKNGELDGENSVYYPNGQISIKAFFKDGKLDGEYLYYNEKGALEQKKYFNSGALTGTYTAYFSVGEEIPEFVIGYKDDKVQDKALEYYANGKLYSEIPFIDGKRHGVEKVYYLNDSIKNEFTYEAGKLQGPYKSYYANGKVFEIGTYENNLLQGPFTAYYPDGTLQSEGNYVDGELEGSSTHYDHDGKKHYSYTNRKGDIINYTFFNKKGEIIKEGKKRGGEFYYNGFAANGNLTSEGQYDVSGGRMGIWKYYGDNGNLKSTGTYENDMAQGIYTSYYTDGTPEWRGNYKNDTLVGYYVSYHKNGSMANQGGYKNGEEQGEWRFYYPDGNLESINYFHQGTFQGMQEYYGVEGKLTKTAIYERDDLLSETFYDHNGSEFQKINYIPSKKDTLLVLKHFNGKAATQTTYIHDVKHGSYKTNFFDGTIEGNGRYLNGMKHGSWTWYFENGKPKVEANYVLDNLDGKFIRYYENGQIEDANYYELGLRSGTWKSYYEDGTLYSNTTYVNDQAHGRKEFYSPTGKLQLVRFYDHGILIGYSYNGKDGKEIEMIPIQNETANITAYYDNGNVSRAMEFKNGQNTGSYKTYYYNGQLKEEFAHQNGEYQGPKISYYPNGNVKERQEFAVGLLHGKSTKYYEDGTLKEESNYKNGIQIGKASFYAKSGKKIKSEDYFNGKIYAQQTF